MFKNAKFGKIYKTRCKSRAVFVGKSPDRPGYSILAIEGTDMQILCDNDGLRYKDVHDIYDIVEEYHEVIDEGALREKAFEWTSFVLDNDLRIKVIALECAMIGYKKAKAGE